MRVPARLSGRNDNLAVQLAIAGVSILLWQTSWGDFVLYPFTILATWFHEMGHGLAAMLAGGKFERLLIFPDGSGLAISLLPADSGLVAAASISAAGPLGPPVAGALLIMASRRRRTQRMALTLLGFALLVSCVFWVRSFTGWLVLPIMGLAIMGIAMRGPADWQRFAVQFLGVQACISTFQHLAYLFTPGGEVGGSLHRSDTGAIADALFLPYWVWGLVISAAIAAILFASFRIAHKR